MTDGKYGGTRACPRCGSKTGVVRKKDHTVVGWFCEQCDGLLPVQGIEAIPHSEDWK